MSLSLPTWAAVLHSATNSQAGTPTVTEAKGPITSSQVREPNPLVVEWGQIGEKKGEDKKKAEPKAEPKAKRNDDKKQSTKKKDEPSKKIASTAPFGKVRVERTPSAQRAAALTVATVLGGPGYIPRGETPEAIINYAMIQYSKAGHVSVIDAVAASALQFATHMGIKWDRRYMPDDLQHLLGEDKDCITEDCGCGAEKKLYAEDAEDIATSMFQTNPLLRQQAVHTVALLLLSLGYNDAAAEVQDRGDWSLLMKYAQMVYANASKIAGGRGGDQFEDALKLRFIEMGLIVTENGAKEVLKAKADAKAKDDHPVDGKKPEAKQPDSKKPAGGVKPFGAHVNGK